MRPTPLPLVSTTLLCNLCSRKFRILDWNETSLATRINAEYLRHYRHWHPTETRQPIQVHLRCEECQTVFAELHTSVTTLMSVGSYLRHEHNRTMHGLDRPFRQKKSA